MAWSTVSKRQPARRSARAIADLAGCYQRVFRGTPTRDDQETVLADLANDTGFYRVTGPGATSDQRAFSEGQRAAYGRIFRFLRMTVEETEALETAARAEALADADLYNEDNP